MLKHPNTTLGYSTSSQNDSFGFGIEENLSLSNVFPSSSIGQLDPTNPNRSMNISKNIDDTPRIGVKRTREESTGVSENLSPTPMQCNNRKRRKLEKSSERKDGEMEFEMNLLLDENDEIVKVIKLNLDKKQPDENLQLIAKFRENIIRILTCMSKMSGIMSRMPPIPIKLNTICVLSK